MWTVPEKQKSFKGLEWKVRFLKIKVISLTKIGFHKIKINF